MNLSIAIDGPAGSGKSTVAKQLANELCLLYIDTGAMYRALTLKALQNGCSLHDDAVLTELSNLTNIQLVSKDGTCDVFLDGELVNDKIRAPQVTENVSRVSAVPGVRKRLVQLQRQMAYNTGVVMDGRDIGTHVLPDAPLKIFLTAGIEERARRRCEEMSAKGYNFALKDMINDLQKRDHLDQTREVSPLRMADDAILVDTTGMEIEEVVDKIVSMASALAL